MIVAAFMSRGWSLGARRQGARRLGVVLGVLALVPGVSAQAAAVPRVGGSIPVQKLWQPGGLQQIPSVPGGPEAKPALTLSQQAAMARAAKPYHPAKVTWPSGSATVTLSAATRDPASRRTAGSAVVPGAARQVGNLPVSLAGADLRAGAAHSATVSFASRAAAQAAGVNGVMLTLTRADGGTSPSPVQVTLNYSAFDAAFGGGYADRLKLVELPACALTTPQVAACRVQQAVAFHNNLDAGTLTAQVPADGASAVRNAASPHTTSTPSTISSSAMVLAATTTPSSSVGTYNATSLSSAGTWAAGGDSGNFTYTYPIQVPPGVGGGAPDVSLSYDSGSVDGRTSATNAQASWIGDGWDYTPGYIERSYQSCSQDGIANSSDLCWAGNQLTLSLGAHSSTMIRDDASGTWKLKNDDGTQIIPLSGVNNGAWQGEAWEIITPDGTQYYFGQNYLPTTTSTGTSTQSAWTEPVYCPKAGDGPTYLSGAPSCNSSSTGANSFAANMAWRWNLAYVVDPHGNLQTYTWVPETNYYDRGYVQSNGSGTNTLYTRGGYLSTIGYGYRLPDAIAGAAPTDTVTFNVAERCTPGYANCSYSYLTSNLSSSSVTSNWPDVPADQICPMQGATCSNYSPTFFTTKALTSITTSVLVGGTAKSVDSYTFSQMFPAPQAGVVSTTDGVSATKQGDGTVAVMWLNSIQRTGNDTLGGGTSASTPPVSFVADMMPNRVDGTTTGAAALYRPRMDSITTESGAQIVVSYYPPACSRLNNVMPSSEDTNTMACFPQYWTPTDGTGPVEDWFNKYPVQEVTVNDLVAPKAWSEAQITSYSYGNAAWHRDDSPLTPDAQRTWNQFRGYATVTTTAGVASAQDVPTQSVTTYLQGMDGDRLKSGATRSVTVTDSVGDSVTDSDWLQGKALETQTLLGVGGAVEKKTINGPWAYTVTATETQADSMPSLVARVPATAETRSYALWHDGTWKKTETDTTYDSSGRVVTSDAKGDGSAAVPEVCTTTTYAQDTTRNMLAYPDETKAIQGACGTAPTTANTVFDTRTFYDSSGTLGQLTGPGDATKIDAVDSYSSGSPVYVTEGSSEYDAYGRITSATDADGNTTTTTYTAPGASPDTVTVKNPMSWSATSTLDPARDVAIASTDVNGELTTETYDGLGRLTAVWSPLHSQAAGDNPDKKFAYNVSNSAGVPTTVSTSTLREDNLYNTGVTFYDGQLRVFQDQAPTISGDIGRLITDTHYNSLGQVVKETSPYDESSTNPITTAYIPQSDAKIPEETEASYDGLGRTVRTLEVADGINQWSTTTAYPGVDQTDVTPPAGGTATSTFVDALGRTIATWSYNTASPTDKASDAIATTYTYTPVGKTATVKDNAGNTWQHSYDLHNRQTQLVDPGAGTSSTTYSPGGLTMTSTDGRGNQLSYTYDALGRKTAEYNTTGNIAESASNELAAWTYDTLEKGQLTSAIRYGDGANDATKTYTETVAGYTALYQSTGTSVTIPSSEGALAGTYQSTSQYDAVTGQQSGQHYYPEGGLPKEQVNYSYSLSGALSGFGGSYVYLNAVSYSPLGQVLSTNFGVYGSQLSRTETYDQPTGRLLTVSDALQTLSAGPLDTTTYTYNQAGAITSESTAQNGVATADTQCFTYDQQNRLTAAWTDTNGTTSTTGSTSAQIFGTGGCNDTAPVAGKVTGGPAPYWESFSYDALGDRISETNHDTSVTSTVNDVTQTLTYTGYNPTTGTNTPASQPDAVQSVATTKGGTTTTSTYTYDTAGNTKTRSGQSFSYDPEGRVSSVTNTSTNQTSTYTYAADGSLLLQRDPANNQTILYLPYGEEIHLNTGNGAVSGLRYYTASPDGVVLVRSSAGTLNYQLTDALHTATTTVNASTLAYTRRYMGPYGNARGTAPTSWPDQHGYLNQPVDPDTGLSLLGARQYDPVLGRFLSVDPILETGDQRQMNGYSYAADNPVNGSDPTGTSTVTVGGGGPYKGTCDSDYSCGCRDNGTGPACGSGDGGTGGTASCGNGVYSDGCAPSTGNGDPNGPGLNQSWLSNYFDSCASRACIANIDKHANDSAYWREQATIAAQKATYWDNLEYAQAVAQEKKRQEEAAQACHGFFGCIGHFVKTGMDFVAQMAPLLDYAALEFGTVPIIGQILVGAALISDGVAVADSLMNGVGDLRKHDYGGAALNFGGALLGVVGFGSYGVSKLRKLDESVASASSDLRSAQARAQANPRFINANRARISTANANLTSALSRQNKVLAINLAAGMGSDLTSCGGGAPCGPLLVAQSF